jgi:hypothetical protein
METFEGTGSGSENSRLESILLFACDTALLDNNASFHVHNGRCVQKKAFLNMFCPMRCDFTTSNFYFSQQQKELWSKLKRFVDGKFKLIISFELFPIHPTFLLILFFYSPSPYTSLPLGASHMPILQKLSHIDLSPAACSDVHIRR